MTELQLKMAQVGYRRASKRNNRIVWPSHKSVATSATYLQVAVNDSVYLQIIVSVAQRVHQLLGDLSPKQPSLVQLITTVSIQRNHANHQSSINMLAGATARFESAMAMSVVKVRGEGG